MFKKNLLIFGFFISPLVFSNPVYLDCSISDGTRFSLKIDEQSNSVTHSGGNGSGSVLQGLFQANNIAYQQVALINGLKVTIHYNIDRTDLSIVKTFSLEPVDARAKIKTKQTTTHPGQCAVSKTSDQKI